MISCRGGFGFLDLPLTICGQDCEYLGVSGGKLSSFENDVLLPRISSKDINQEKLVDARHESIEECRVS